MTFKTELGTNIFRQKYASNQYETWSDKAHSIVNSVCGTLWSWMILSRRITLSITKSSFPVVDTYGMQGERQGSTTTATYSGLKRIPERSGLICGNEQALAL